MRDRINIAPGGVANRGIRPGAPAVTAASTLGPQPTIMAPDTVRVVSLVTKSPGVPVSSAMAVIATAVAGAVVSTVTLKAADGALLLPAVSVIVA